MLKELIKFANKLDTLGLTKEADKIDHLVRIASYKLLDTPYQGYSNMVNVKPEENLAFQIKYVLDIIFDNDYQWGMGGDLSDMPMETKRYLISNAFEAAKLNKFNVENFLTKIREEYPKIDINADMHTYNAIKDDLKEIEEIQRRYQQNIAPKQAPVTPDYKGISDRIMDRSPKYKYTPQSEAPTAPGVTETGIERSKTVSKPVAQTTPQVPRRNAPRKDDDSIQPLLNAVNALPSDTGLPAGIGNRPAAQSAPQMPPMKPQKGALPLYEKGLESLPSSPDLSEEISSTTFKRPSRGPR